MDKAQILRDIRAGDAAAIVRANDAGRTPDARDDDLFTLDELALDGEPENLQRPLRYWKGPCPRPPDQVEYRRRLDRDVPGLAELVAEMPHVVLAGGFAMRHLAGIPHHSFDPELPTPEVERFGSKHVSDYDFFVVGAGEEPAALWAVAADWLRRVAAHVRARRGFAEGDRVAAYLQPGLLRVVWSRAGPTYFSALEEGPALGFLGFDPDDTGEYLLAEYQLVLRAYPSTAALLHGFDLGSSAVAFDGATTYVTAMGAYAALRMENIVHGPYMSLSYGRRLEKYHYRGFTPVLYQLDPARLALEPDEVLKLRMFSIERCVWRPRRGRPEKEYWNIYWAHESKESDYDDDRTLGPDPASNQTVPHAGWLDGSRGFVALLAEDALDGLTDNAPEVWRLLHDHAPVALAREGGRLRRAPPLWITQDPGRQWSATRNPAAASAEELYGAENLA